MFKKRQEDLKVSLSDEGHEKRTKDNFDNFQYESTSH
jgi:hypothetical protein